MKITKTVKCWEIYKDLNYRAWFGGFIEELLSRAKQDLCLTKEESFKELRVSQCFKNIGDLYDKPKRATLAITYEVEE